MGRVRNSRRRATKNKSYKKSHSTKRRARDVDQIQDDLKKEIPLSFEISDDLPGLGQYYCMTCARHFSDEKTLQVHTASKDHKRRLKDVAQKQYTQNEAELGAGRSIEKLPPAHPQLPSQSTMTE